MNRNVRTVRRTLSLALTILVLLIPQCHTPLPRAIALERRYSERHRALNRGGL